MFTKIRLKNFKCFRDEVTVPLGKINLFTGINGRGKSTVLQALLLMRQSPEHNRTTNQIIFNGSCVSLGRFNDVKNSSVSQSEPIEIRFEFQKDETCISLPFLLTKNYDDDMMADILMMEESSLRPMGEFIYENINFTTTHYISADRIGPQDYYPKQSFAEFPNVGRQGEYTANMLSKKRNDTVYEALCLETGATHTVLDQTEAWLEKIFDGGKIDVRPIDEANLVVMEMNSERTQHLYKPTNVGFGYSYALPIIVSGLIAQKGERLIIENPEAHLHPYAQSQITKFLAKVSACGVQIFIESHSEHILNALRIAVLDKIITTEDLNILYFDRNETNQVTKIPVQEDGAIEEWPVGFFDQTDKDFERLFGF